MAQPTIKRTQSASDLPSFLAPPTTDANQAETFGSGAETTGMAEPDELSQHVNEAVQQVFPKADMSNLSDMDDHAATVQDQINRLDMERLKVAAQLVNTFNRAIQVQAGRSDWNEHDYASFIVALRSIDRIGYDAKLNIKK